MHIMQSFKFGIIALIFVLGSSRPIQLPAMLKATGDEGGAAVNIAPPRDYTTHKYKGMIYHESGNAHTEADKAIAEAAKVIRKKIASGMKSRFGKLYNKLTKFSDDEGFVRPGIVFCGASRSETTHTMLTEPGAPEDFHASGGRLIDFDGYGQVEYGSCECENGDYNTCVPTYSGAAPEVKLIIEDQYDQIFTKHECDEWNGK